MLCESSEGDSTQAPQANPLRKAVVQQFPITRRRPELEGFGFWGSFRAVWARFPNRAGIVRELGAQSDLKALGHVE
jgi:hypothetical protein